MCNTYITYYIGFVMGLVIGLEWRVVQNGLVGKLIWPRRDPNKYVQFGKTQAGNLHAHPSSEAETTLKLNFFQFDFLHLGILVHFLGILGICSVSGQFGPFP